MKLKRKDVVRLHNTLMAVSEFAKGELAYAVVRNLKKLESEILAIAKLEPEIPQELREYESARITIVEEFAEKDENGTAVIKNNNYTIPEEVRADFDTKISELQAKYAPIIDSYKNLYDEYIKSLEVESDVDTYEIKQAHLSSDITASQIKDLSVIIEGLN